MWHGLSRAYILAISLEISYEDHGAHFVFMDFTNERATERSSRSLMPSHPDFYHFFTCTRCKEMSGGPRWVNFCDVDTASCCFIRERKLVMMGTFGLFAWICDEQIARKGQSPIQQKLNALDQTPKEKGRKGQPPFICRSRRRRRTGR